MEWSAYEELSKDGFKTRWFTTKPWDDLLQEQKEKSDSYAQETEAKLSLNKFCEQFFEVQRPKWSYSNFKLYRMTQYRLVAYFGKDAKLNSITHRMAEVFVSKQKNLAEGSENKPLSPWSLQQLVRQCRAIFNAAILRIIVCGILKSIYEKQVLSRTASWTYTHSAKAVVRTGLIICLLGWSKNWWGTVPFRQHWNFTPLLMLHIGSRPQRPSKSYLRQVSNESWNNSRWNNR